MAPASESAPSREVSVTQARTRHSKRLRSRKHTQSRHMLEEKMFTHVHKEEFTQPWS
ncbi:hypothetical protein PISMIDRAFT_689278 [Pisolithus microcarpus 441]|uniref:Uncharacterized protein n=1 Tax=Pisolithus microcarpus 441 TaxID=765257 RepID=A0A0C9YQP8_9AGAM|nr:hypothetical protein PISMIDRAFT_689278 [Pisolithus microcarpus 441]